MKKTRGGKTKKIQKKIKKIKGGSKSKSITRKNPEIIYQNEKPQIILIAAIYADAINELIFCMYDAFDKIENAKLTEEERNFHKAFINCAVNDLFKPLHTIGMISKKDITRMIEQMRKYINNKSVGGAGSFANTKTGTIVFLVLCVIYFATIHLTSTYNNSVANVDSTAITSTYLPSSNSRELTVVKKEHMKEMYTGINELVAEIKQNPELRKYLTNKFGSCYIISFFYELTLSNMSDEKKEKIIKLIAEYFKGSFMSNSPNPAFLPANFIKIIHGPEYENNGESLGVVTSQDNNINPIIKHMGVIQVPSLDNQVEYINDILKKRFDKSQIHIGGNSTLIIVMTTSHAFLLLTYYSLDENNEVKVANCVLDPNMIIPNVNINSIMQLNMLCDENFPLPQYMFPELKVVVTDSNNIFRNQARITYIQTPNDDNNLNTQHNIYESIQCMTRIMRSILNGINKQIELFEKFEKNEMDLELKPLFGKTKKDLIAFNGELGKFYNNRNPSESKITNEMQEYEINRDTAFKIKSLYRREGNFHGLSSSSKKSERPL